MRWLGVSLLALLASPALPDAAARGGNYRGPNGAVPPNLREPADPAPPPPPPPSTPPPQPPVPARRAPFPAPPGTRRATTDFSAWPFWYHHNRELYERRPAAALTFARTSKLCSTTILPALVEACDRKKHGSETLAATALLALGRSARDDTHVSLLLTAFADREQRKTSNAAAIALGMLRRTDPAQQFSPAMLDAVRNQLYLTVKNDAIPGRLRALAALSIGVLGDQPTTGASMAKATTARLFALLSISHRYPDVPSALMHAASLQPPASWSAAQREQLRAVIKNHVLLPGVRAANADAHAALALGRVGTSEDLPALAATFADDQAPFRNVRRSAAIALGTLAERLGSADRKQVTAVLLAALSGVRDATTRKLLTMSLARAAAADARAAGAVTDLTRDLGTLLRADAVDPSSGTRSYAALGLGVIGRALSEKPSAETGQWRNASALKLRGVLADTTRDAPTRGACALGLGLLGASGEGATLLSVVTNAKLPMTLRAPAARALGLLGSASDQELQGLEAPLLAAGTSGRLVQDAAAALGMLDARDRVVTILGTLRTVRYPATRGAATLAVGNLAYRASVDTLLALLTEAKAELPAREAACAALGLMADPEPRPSLSRVTCHANWRTSADVFRAFADLL